MPDAATHYSGGSGWPFDHILYKSSNFHFLFYSNRYACDDYPARSGAGPGRAGTTKHQIYFALKDDLIWNGQLQYA